MEKDIKVAAIKIIPQSLLLLILLLVVAFNYEEMKALIKNITHVEALGISINIDQETVPVKYKKNVQGFRLSDALRDRLEQQREHIKSAHILITKDKPEASRWLADVFRQLGAKVDIGICSDESKLLLQKNTYEIVISDISWDQCQSGFKNAIEFYNDEHKYVSGKRRILFYISNPWSPRSVPDYSLDVTTSLTELIHLTLDIIERGGDA